MVQLEPGSAEGHITAAEHRTRLSIQTEVDNKWSDRMEREDTITLSKHETLDSVVQRLGQEAMNLKEKKKWQRGQHRATSLGSGGSTTSHRIPGAQVGSAPSGGTERVGSLEGHKRHQT